MMECTVSTAPRIAVHVKGLELEKILEFFSISSQVSIHSGEVGENP